MKPLRQCLLGTLLLGSLALIGLGCGDDSGTGQKIDTPPDLSAQPDMSSMPGFDKSKGGMTPPPSTTP